VLSDTPLSFHQLYLGAQDEDYFIATDESMYFYFKNWREESIKFTLNPLKSDAMLDFKVGKMREVEDDLGWRIPRYAS
jgi:hypothetical protein